MVKYCEIFEMEFEMVFIEPLRRTEQNTVLDKIRFTKIYKFFSN